MKKKKEKEKAKRIKAKKCCIGTELSMWYDSAPCLIGQVPIDTHYQNYGP